MVNFYKNMSLEFISWKKEWVLLAGGVRSAHFVFMLSLFSSGSLLVEFRSLALWAPEPGSDNSAICAKVPGDPKPGSEAG